MKSKPKIKSNELIEELLPVLSWNNKTTVEALKRRNELRTDTLEFIKKMSIEQKIINLFTVTYACQHHRVFKTFEEKSHFLDDMTNSFFGTFYKDESSQNFIKDLAKETKDRFIFYYDIIEKINRNKDNDKYVIELEKKMGYYCGIDESEQEIKTRLLSDPMGNKSWYALMYLQLQKATDILDKYSEVIFS